jgi:glycosyltransferase involved in cell wall biosynthesis
MDKNNKFSVIINYPYFFNVGGIETYLFFFIKYCIEKKIRVLWIRNPKYEVAQSFRSVLLGNQVERVNLKNKRFGWFKLKDIHLQDATYILFCTSPIYMCLNQDIIRHNPGSKIYPIYAVASEKGTTFYLEDYFHLPYLKKMVKNAMSSMVENWDSHNAVRCFNVKQLDALEIKYGISIRNKESKVLGVLHSVKEVSDDFLRAKYRTRDVFTIITVSRFDFPHKAYLLGLIRAFGKLKGKYPQLRLQIIGYGPHEDKVKNEIEKLPSAVRHSIELLGEVSPVDLGVYFRKADLNISVAAAASGGACEGTLTLVGRNFCGDVCEVYGYYDECINMTTSLVHGNNVEPYIEEVLSMSENEYVRKCLDGFAVFGNSRKPNPDYLFETSEKVDLPVSNTEIRQMKVIKHLITLSRIIEKLKKFWLML